MQDNDQLQRANRTILITGAGGFVGQEAVKKALAEGWNVVAVVRQLENAQAGLSEVFAKLRMQYPERLCLERADLADEPRVQDLIAHHPEIDAVLHAAAIVRPKHGDEQRVQHVNVEATKILAQACEKLAEERHRPIRFHFISSVAALYYEKNTLPQHNAAIAAEAYGKSKCDVSHWLGDQSSKLHQLDIRITYPPALIDEVPSSAWISRVIEMGQKNDKQFSEVKADDPHAITRMAYSKHYLRDVFACFDAPLKPGVREYAVAPDFMLEVGQLVRLAKQVVLEKQCNTPPGERDVGEQLEMDFNLRPLPTIAESLGLAPHPPVDLYSLLGKQYDVFSQRAPHRH